MVLNDLPASGPRWSSTGWMPSRQWTSRPSRRSLSISRPVADAGAGLLVAPVGVWPRRRIFQRPGGASQTRVPSLAQLSAHIDDRVQRDGGVFRQRFEVGLPAGAPAALARLGLPLVDAEPAVHRRGDGEDGDVAVVAEAHLGLRQLLLDAPATRPR